jgi:hypothetical protein
MPSLKSCHFLGLDDDPKTKLDFPSKGNMCYRPKHLASIDPTHQKDYCLSGMHANCPIYASYNVTSTLPAFLGRPKKKWQIIFSPRSLAMLAVIFVALIASILVSSMRLFAGESDPNPGASTYVAQSMLEGLLLPTHRNTIPFEQNNNQTPAAIAKQCTPPTGWIEYLTQPTDSLFRLSALYNLSVLDIQQANCMGDETVILPETTLYLPDLPSPTPTITNHIVPIQPTKVPDSNPPPSVDPTRIPMPPTPIPPTIAPTTVPKTPLPTSEIKKKKTPDPKPGKPDHPKPKKKPKKKHKTTQAMIINMAIFRMETILWKRKRPSIAKKAGAIYLAMR